MGITELLIIGVALLLLFGAKKIPEMIKGVGKGIREFKEAKDKAAAAEKTQDEEPEK
jgi:sec-independent protein translocase protein TatA